MSPVAGAIVLLALTAGPALAQQAPAPPEVQRLREYIGSPEHLQAVRAAIAAFEPAALAATCKAVRPVKGRGWKPLDAATFEGSSKAPKTGFWQETWEVDVCGKPGVRSLAFRATAGQGVVPLPMFPGESLADARLQLDAGPLALNDYAPAALSCDQRGRIQVIHSAVTRRPPQAGAAWSERWTVAGCGRTANVDVDFRPDAQGRLSYEFRRQGRR